jgi:hypothetical protein
MAITKSFLSLVILTFLSSSRGPNPTHGPLPVDC